MGPATFLEGSRTLIDLHGTVNVERDFKILQRVQDRTVDVELLAAVSRKGMRLRLINQQLSLSLT